MCALVLAAPLARAQGNYRSAALGGRSALMGDTGIALGTDGAAPFLNPATVVRVEATLALSVTFVSLDLLHASNWYVPGPVDPIYGSAPVSGADISRVSGNAIPSTFCLFTGLPRIVDKKDSRAGTEKFATCFGTTEIQQFDWTGQGYQPMPGTGTTAQSSSVRMSWQRFVVAPTYAVDITDSFALGASIQGTFTNFGRSASVGAITSAAGLPTTSSSYEFGASGSDFGLSALLGATYTLGHLTIGASIQSPDLSIYGHGNVSNYVQLTSSTAQAATTYLGQGGFHAREPTRMSLGVGWDWPRGSVELDGQLALADGDALELSTQGAQFTLPSTTGTPTSLLLHTRYQPTLNASIGAEFYVRRSLSLLTGFATDFSAVDNLSPTSLAPAQVNRLLLSFGVGTHGDTGTLIVGAQAYYGWGSAFAPNVYANPPVETPTSVRTFGVLFVLAGATNLKALANAVSDLRKDIGRPK